MLQTFVVFVVVIAVLVLAAIAFCVCSRVMSEPDLTPNKVSLTVMHFVGVKNSGREVAQEQPMTNWTPRDVSAAVKKKYNLDRESNEIAEV